MNRVENQQEKKRHGFASKIGQLRLCQFLANTWRKFKKNHPNIAQFLVFFMLSNGITILQILLMAVLRPILSNTGLIDISFQWIRIGVDETGSKYFAFNYPAGTASNAGGLAYFLSYTITIALAQILNFFAQRKITFKSNTNPWYAAMWYAIAFIAIIFVAAIAQGFYRAPIYDLMTTIFGNDAGFAVADVITMIINAAISFWVFFPIFKLIFRRKEDVQIDSILEN